MRKCAHEWEHVYGIMCKCDIIVCVYIDIMYLGVRCVCVCVCVCVCACVYCVCVHVCDCAVHYIIPEYAPLHGPRATTCMWPSAHVMHAPAREMCILGM